MGDGSDAAEHATEHAAADAVDPERLASWLAETVDPTIRTVDVTRLAAGHSSGAWRVDAHAAGGTTAMVLKSPGEPSVVHLRDAAREARIMRAVGEHAGPVPPVLAIDTAGCVMQRPAFVMDLVPGRSVADSSAGGYHDDPELRALPPTQRREVWESFHDALARLHLVDAAAVPDAAVGGGVRDVLEYWRASLYAVLPDAAVPRQRAALDWLTARLPADADDAPAVCLGDARLVNGVLDGTQVRALVDFEVAYLGNPAADIGYSLLMDERHRQGTREPLDLPTADETWTRWSRRTGRPAVNREYWTAFAATVICITATRAMLQWGLSQGAESDNPLVSHWEMLIERASAAMGGG